MNVKVAPHMEPMRLDGVPTGRITATRDGVTLQLRVTGDRKAGIGTPEAVEHVIDMLRRHDFRGEAETRVIHWHTF